MTDAKVLRECKFGDAFPMAVRETEDGLWTVTIGSTTDESQRELSGLDDAGVAPFLLLMLEKAWYGINQAQEAQETQAVG